MSKFIPNSFQIPNAFVDERLKSLSGNAVKCYLLIARKTTGWQKSADRISTVQFMEFCGIKDRKTAFAVIDELEKIRLINVVRTKGEINEFSLNFFIDKNDDYELVPKNGTSTKNLSELVPKNGTSTSTKNWDTTKDNIKNNITNNHLNPPKGGDVVRDEFLRLLEGKISSNSAKQLHDKVEEILSANGFECKREFPVQDRGDGRSGRIDLVVSKHDVTIGLELDNETARDKSIFKLEQINLDYKFVGLRNGVVGERLSVSDVSIFSVNHKPLEKIDYQAVMDAYNQANSETGGRLPYAQSLTEKRKRAMKKLLTEHLSKPTLECAVNYFERLFELLRPFHVGEGERGWRANFDWAIRGETVVKVREEAL